MSCDICAESFDALRTSVHCLDSSCPSRICLECAEGYLDQVMSESLAPKCTRPGCNYIYLLRSVPSLNDKYVECCRRHLQRDYPPQPSEADRLNEIVTRLREERKAILRREFPLAVATLAELVLGTRLNQVTPPPPAEGSSRTHRRLCMNTYCSGFLDSNLLCTTCQTQFCVDCEEPRRSEHQCDPGLKETIRIRKEFPVCPRCGQSVDKDNGCNSVTCNICGTAFDYATGQIYGSHVHGHPFQNNRFTGSTTGKLSVTYRSLISDEQLVLLLQIESFVDELPIPKEPDYPTLLAKGNHLITARKYNDFQVRLYRRQKAAQTMAQIEERIRHHNCTVQDLQGWLEYLRNL